MATPNQAGDGLRIGERAQLQGVLQLLPQMVASDTPESS
jgi:hypothetical protein